MSNPRRVIIISKNYQKSFNRNYNAPGFQRQQYNSQWNNTYGGNAQGNGNGNGNGSEDNNNNNGIGSSSFSSFNRGERGSRDSGKALPVIGKRKAIPRAKLTQEMLQGKSGVDRIIQEFKGMHFSKECDWRVQEENLHQLMHKYETWGRQLVPQLSFEQFISSLEKIASKREFRSRVEGVEVGLSFNIDRQVQEEVDAGKRMRSLEDEQQQQQQAQQVQNSNNNNNGNGNGNGDYVVIDTYEAVAQEPPQKRVLTDEDRKRIEMNKQKARERRMAKELERQRAQQQQRQQQHDDFDQDIEIQLQIEQELEQERQRAQEQQQQQESNQDSQQTQIDSQQTQIDSQQTQIDSQQ